MKRDLPRRNEVTLKRCTRCSETDWRGLVAGFGAICVAGIVKVLLLNRFGGLDDRRDQLQ